MPFQYRTKRRPNMLQTAMAGFMQGATEGARTGYFKGKEQTLQKAVAAKEKDEKDRKMVIDQLTGIKSNIYDTGIKSNIDKLIFDIVTGVKPISEAYALIQGLTSGAYEKPEKIDFTKTGGDIATRNTAVAKAKAQQEQKMRADPAVSAKLKELNNLNAYIDKLYSHATNPKNEKGLGWMTREDYVSKYLDTEIKGEHDKLMSQLKPQPEDGDPDFVGPPASAAGGGAGSGSGGAGSGQHTRGYLPQGVQTMLSGFQTGKMYIKGGKRYEYLGGDPHNSSSWREVE